MWSLKTKTSLCRHTSYFCVHSGVLTWKRKTCLGGDRSGKLSRLGSKNAEWRQHGNVVVVAKSVVSNAQSPSAAKWQQKAGGERAIVGVKHLIYNCNAPSCLVSWLRCESSAFVWRQSRAEQASKVAASGRPPAAAPDLVASDSSFISHPHCSQQPRHASRDTTQAAHTGGKVAKHAVGRQHHNVVRLNKGNISKEQNIEEV